MKKYLPVNHQILLANGENDYTEIEENGRTIHLYGVDPDSEEKWVHAYTTLPEDLIICEVREEQPTEKEILQSFYKSICEEAEKTMSTPPYKLEGAHYNAMKRILNQKGIEV